MYMQDTINSDTLQKNNNNNHTYLTLKNMARSYTNIYKKIYICFYYNYLFYLIHYLYNYNNLTLHYYHSLVL